MTDVGGADAAAGHERSSSWLRFGCGPDGRTYLAGQHVVAPLAFTRTFHLEEASGPCTAILQSVAGPLLAGDDVSLDVAIDGGAHAHVLTAASTPVHAGDGTARYRASARLADGARLLLAPRPWVLFPGAHLDASTELDLGDGAAAVVVEALGRHDPAGHDRPWGRLRSSTTVRRAGHTLAVDRLDLTGDEATAPGLLRGAVWVATVWLLGGLPVEHLVRTLRDGLSQWTGATVGVGELPGGAGVVVRVLAANGQQLRDAVGSAEAVGRVLVLGEDRRSAEGKAAGSLRTPTPAGAG